MSQQEKDLYIASLYTARANGEIIQEPGGNFGDDWFTLVGTSTLYSYMRIKPKEPEKAITEPLIKGCGYFIIVLDLAELCSGFVFFGSSDSARWQDQGLVFKTKEGARAKAKELLGVLKS